MPREIPQQRIQQCDVFGVRFRSRSRTTQGFIAAMSILLGGMQPNSAVFAQETVDIPLSREEIGEICERPYAPDPRHFEKASEYVAAREVYFTAASVYVSDCVDGWITETRRRYEEMYHLESAAYLRDRQSVMDEMRDAAQREF